MCIISVTIISLTAVVTAFGVREYNISFRIFKYKEGRVPESTRIMA